jgi:mono/diheme cytochrome c family protein
MRVNYSRIIAGTVIALVLLGIVACAPTSAAPTAAPTEEPARPTNEGGPGPALDLTGDATAGQQIYVDNCKKCHGDDGTGGVANPGSVEDIPELNPIDSTMVNADPKVFAYNIDLFIEHGSTPDGTPKESMPAWGDEKKLTPQQIADAIAYIMSLNK